MQPEITKQFNLAFCTIVFHNKGPKTQLSLINPPYNPQVSFEIEGRVSPQNNTESTDVITNITQFKEFIQKYKLTFDALKCNYEPKRRDEIKSDDVEKQKQAFHFVDAGLLIRNNEGEEIVPLADYETCMRNVLDALDIILPNPCQVDEKFDLLIELKEGESGKIFLMFCNKERENKMPGIALTTLVVKEGTGHPPLDVLNTGSSKKEEGAS